MKHFYNYLKRAVIGAICFFPLMTNAQLNVNSAASATDLANAILGSGVTVSNVVLDCGPGGSGIFTNGNTTNIGLTSGIILSTGHASDAGGPNNNPGLTFNQPDAYNGDSDLDPLVAGSLNDVCKLDFDFVSTSDVIQVQYVFASEEYNEYVCSQFNDVFAFFVNGPNPLGGNYVNQNVALVPTTSLPVSVNTINNGTTGSEGFPGGCTSLAYSAYYHTNAGGLTIQYDGFTVTLTAQINITPGETYHFKFAIADVSDSALDSGVFIRSQSFSIFNCQAGELSVENAALCSTDDISDVVSVSSNSTATGDEYAFLLTDLEGNILEINTTGDFDLSAYGNGNYLVFGISVDGEVSGIEVGENISDINVAEDEGCFDISNPVAVSLESCLTFELVACADDIILECGSDLSDFTITGLPQIILENEGDLEVSFTYSDDYLSQGDCISVIIRTWTITLGDMSLMCTSVITLIDTQGPVISGVEPIVEVQCIEDVPAPAAATALDACSGDAEVETFESNTGEILYTCCLTTANGPGADWAVWLPVLTEGCCINSANWVFDGCGHLDQYVDGTAHLYGTVYNTGNPSQQFIVSLWLENKADWATWSGLGRNYKNDLLLSCATVDHINWDYYELVNGFSTLTGAGALAGDVLYLSHMPASYYFGFQKGIGANNKNCNNGISGWFTYEGFVDGEHVEGHGDVNADAACEPGGNENDICSNSTIYTYLYRAEDACGNATIVSQEIVVNDTTAPTFDNCPESISIECSDAIPAVAEGITATDNCIGDVTVTYVGETSEGNDCYRTLTRTWIAVDVCENRATCIQTITIVDTTAPVLNGTPAAEITVECSEVPAPAEVTATDNCDTLVTVNYSEEIAPGQCAGQYTIYRSWSAYDNCDHGVWYSQTVHVIDTTAPVFDPYEFYSHVECDQIPESGLTATDNCGEVTVELVSESYNSGGCLGVLYRVYTASDDCGNSTTVEQFIAIQDWTAPELVGVPADTTIQCTEVSVGDDGNYFDNGGVYGVDNCGYHFYHNCLLPVTVNYSEEVVPTEDGCPESYDIVRTWVGIDYCENDTTATQTVHVIDTTAPYFVEFPQDLEVSCDEEVPAVVYPIAIDGCDTDVEVFLGEEILPGSCPQEQFIYRTFRGQDNCGNEVVETQTIHVYDNEAPSFNDQPAYYTYECNTEIPTIQPTATDNCGEITYTSLDTAYYSVECISYFNRLWTATDECGNVSYFTQYIQIVDTTAPVVNPYDFEISMPCDDINNSVLISATDNCNEVEITYSDEHVSGDCAGRIIRTYHVQDICGNVTEGIIQQFISLTDSIAPVGVEPSDITVSCDDEVPYFNPEFTDNCAVELTYSHSLPLADGYCGVSVTETWTATDNCGNVGSVDRIITYVDETNPWFVYVPESFEVECSDMYLLLDAVAYDNCDLEVSVSVETSEEAGDCPAESTITRTFTATDECGNTAVAVQTIHIVDTTAPVFNYDAQYIFTYECDETAAIVEPSASDLCSEIELSYADTNSWQDGCASGFTRVWTATDACGNASQYHQFIYFYDTTAPVVEPFEVELEMPCDNIFSGVLISATDNCNEVNIDYSDEYVSGECAGKIIRTYTVSDICGNYADGIYQQIITLIDETAPVVEVEPVDLIIQCGEETPAYYPVWSDNCDDSLAVSAISGIATDGCNQIISTVWFAEDNCGNISSVSRMVTIVDTIAPYFYEVPSDWFLDCSDYIFDGDAKAYDVCDGEVEVTFEDVRIDGDCPSTYTLVRTFTAADDCGNEVNYVQHIYVSDTTAPVFTYVPAGGNYTCEEGVPADLATADDDCSEFSITHSDEVISTTIIVGGGDDNGSGDDCGQFTTYSAGGWGNGNNPQGQYATANFASAFPAGLTVGCGGNTYQFTSAAAVQAFLPAGGSSFVLSGNTVNPTGIHNQLANQLVAASLSVGFDSYDSNFSPSAGSMSSLIYVGGPFAGFTVGQVLAIANNHLGGCDATYSLTDVKDALEALNLNYDGEDQDLGNFTCDGESNGDGDGEELCGSLITRTWTAVDACGNASYATTVYFVYDNVAPTFDQELENVYVQCASEIPAAVDVTATDNCSEASITVDVDVLQSDSCGNQTILVTYTAADYCGNTSYASYYIYVNDDIEPTLDGCPSDLVLDCDAIIPEPATVTATDNCDSNVEVSYEEYIYGDLPAEGSIADCDLMTPVRPASNPCVYPYDWAMALFAMPEAHKWYALSGGSLVTYPDGSMHLVATMHNVLNPSNGWLVNVWFDDSMDWSEWSTQSFPTSFKADCGGEAANHTQWTYLLLQAGAGAEMTGFGAYAGSSLDLTHAPANQYFGFQLGDGANNYNGADNGFGGWFSYHGTFLVDGSPVMSGLAAGAGDFAFELDCCPDYWIVRQWTALDCSGNASTCTQTITFDGFEIPEVSSPVAPTHVAEKTEGTLSVAPNPASDNALFTFKAAKAGKTTLEIFDLAGAKVADVYMGVVEAGVEYKVNYNVSSMATGVYMYRLTNADNKEMGRMIINK